MRLLGYMVKYEIGLLLPFRKYKEGLRNQSFEKKACLAIKVLLESLTEDSKKANTSWLK